MAIQNPFLGLMLRAPLESLFCIEFDTSFRGYVVRLGFLKPHFRQRWPASLCRQGVMIATSCLDYNDVK